jgi:hypothetical protein
MSPDGSRFVLMLQNSGLDDLPPLRVQVRSTAGRVRDLSTGHPADITRTSDDMIELTLPAIEAWSHRVVVGSE